MKRLIPLLLLFTGCVSLPLKITEWKDNHNQVFFENGTSAHIIGNPRITCWTSPNHLLWAEGYFMYVDDRDGMYVDEFGKDIVWLHPNTWGTKNYCILGE